MCIRDRFNTFTPSITRGPYNTNLQSLFKTDATIFQANDYGQLAYNDDFNGPGDVQSNPHNVAHLSTGQVWHPDGAGGWDLDWRGANLAGGFGDATEDPFFFF